MYTAFHDLLLQLAADPDINVKNGSELLDRLMKVKQLDTFYHFCMLAYVCVCVCVCMLACVCMCVLGFYS